MISGCHVFFSRPSRARKAGGPGVGPAPVPRRDCSGINQWNQLSERGDARRIVPAMHLLFNGLGLHHRRLVDRSCHVYVHGSTYERLLRAAVASEPCSSRAPELHVTQRRSSRKESPASRTAVDNTSMRFPPAVLFFPRVKHFFCAICLFCSRCGGVCDAFQCVHTNGSITRKKKRAGVGKEGNIPGSSATKTKKTKNENIQLTGVIRRY